MFAAPPALLRATLYRDDADAPLPFGAVIRERCARRRRLLMPMRRAAMPCCALTHADARRDSALPTPRRAAQLPPPFCADARR